MDDTSSQWALYGAGFRGDFLSLLRAQGMSPMPALNADGADGALQHTESTTVLALRYKDGALIAGDRRAVAGSAIMYDRADKVLEIDERSVMAISGSPAAAYEMARVLEYSFRYYKRSQLQEMSLEGKLRALSQLIKENLGMALQGIGGVLPIFAAYDNLAGETRLYFYDALGAQFEMTDFAAAGSGSVWIRGALYYENRWRQRIADLDRRAAIQLTQRMLQAAAHFDSATGGGTPTVKCLTEDGVETLSEETLTAIGGSDV
ncbi:MAG: proteasome subunit alpha [Candidatus Poribacteria bacterium]|nr:proteasome subunit alpha [Candidatus Poribacteria bacterium]